MTSVTWVLVKSESERKVYRGFVGQKPYVTVFYNEQIAVWECVRFADGVSIAWGDTARQCKQNVVEDLDYLLSRGQAVKL